jgi:hypothetical protein
MRVRRARRRVVRRARDQGYAFREIEEHAALMTDQDGKSRKIWVDAAHDGARVSITRLLTI